MIKKLDHVPAGPRGGVYQKFPVSSHRCGIRPRTALLIALVALGLAITLMPPAPISARPGRTLTLVDNGRSSHAIVVRKDAPRAQREAALELQHYLQAASGATLPIVDAPLPGQPSIYIGHSWAKELGIDVSTLGPEDFSISVHGRDLLIAGRDTDGDPWPMHWRYHANTPTLYGVDTLLDRYVGVRWYWPGALGEEVPHRPIIAIPAALQLREGPAFAARFFPLSEDLAQPGRQRWFRHNRLGSSLKISHWHAWFQVIPESKYLESHPEYFALVNGVRGTRGGPIGHQHQLCTSNPEVRRLFAEEVIRFFDANPDARAYSISANDAGGHCECDACRALDVDHHPNGAPVLTDRIFAFYNEVARQVGLKHPDRLLTVYAYDESLKASSRLKLEPNLLVMDVYNFASMLWYDPAWRQQMHENSARWRKLDPKAIYLSFYYPDAFNLWSLPQASSRAVIDQVRMLKAQHGQGFHIVPGGGFSGFGHDAWLLARLAWNPDLDPEGVLRDYYEGLFGAEAGALVRKYHGLIEKQMEGLALELSGKIPAVPFTQAVERYRPIEKEATALLNRAREKTRTEKQAQRLSIVRAGWEYVRLNLDGLTILSKMEAEASRPEGPDRATVELAAAAIDARRAFVERLKADPDRLVLDPDTIFRYDRGACTPFVPGRVRNLLEGRRFEAEAASIDADRPTAADWERAPELPPFVDACTSEPAMVQTRGRALYNRRALFLELTALEPDPALLKADQLTDRDSAVWMENDLEVFLDPGNTGQRYVQLLTNSLGTQADLKKGEPDGAHWSGDWKVRVTRGEGAWTAELEIPFAVIGTTAPAPGSSWRVNVGRLRRGPIPEASAWSPTWGGFQNPRAFGELRFRAPAGTEASR